MNRLTFSISIKLGLIPRRDYRENRKNIEYIFVQTIWPKNVVRDVYNFNLKRCKTSQEAYSKTLKHLA